MKPTNSTKPVSSLPTREDITEYMPLVHQVVARLLRRLPPNVQREDLIAAGSYGLVDALRKSPDRGPAFEWYARIRIRGAAVDELRSQDWLTRRARTRVAKAQAEGQSRGPGGTGERLRG
jgi:RNA polymerase sigma factor for flagellar operon FliA